jgi:hypothetical protein
MLPIDDRKRAGFTSDSANRMTSYEVVDAAELANRWRVPKTWILEQTRSRALEPIPCVRLGRYVRFEWESPSLLKWWERRRQ